MPQDMRELKIKLGEIYRRANQYFKNAQELMQKTPKGPMASDVYRIEREFWSYMPEAERQTGETIVSDLIELMSEVATAVRQSPLLDDADQREIVTYTKTMRAAFYFRKYMHRPPEAIYEDGMVVGVSPAQQAEEAVGIKRAQAFFEPAYTATLKIVDLIGPGSAREPLSSSTPSRPVSKYRPNTAFIMMWMDQDRPELDDIRDAIKSTFEAFGIQALRSDDIEHEDMITRRILDEIATSEFLVADLTGSRPSVYYEVGYAHALGKRVILYKKKGTALHFDLALHNCPEYENLGDLKTKLNKRLQALTNREEIR